MFPSIFFLVLISFGAAAAADTEMPVWLFQSHKWRKKSDLKEKFLLIVKTIDKKSKGQTRKWPLAFFLTLYSYFKAISGTSLPRGACKPCKDQRQTDRESTVGRKKRRNYFRARQFLGKGRVAKKKSRQSWLPRSFPLDSRRVKEGERALACQNLIAFYRTLSSLFLLTPPQIAGLSASLFQRCQIDSKMAPIWRTSSRGQL